MVFVSEGLWEGAGQNRRTSRLASVRAARSRGKSALHLPPLPQASLTAFTEDAYRKIIRQIPLLRGDRYDDDETPHEQSFGSRSRRGWSGVRGAGGLCARGAADF